MAKIGKLVDFVSEEPGLSGVVWVLRMVLLLIISLNFNYRICLCIFAIVFVCVVIFAITCVWYYEKKIIKVGVIDQILEFELWRCTVLCIKANCCFITYTYHHTHCHTLVPIIKFLTPSITNLEPNDKRDNIELDMKHKLVSFLKITNQITSWHWTSFHW